ncbi:MAG: carboxypeptidase regulatory-like domain-containing protein [Armatimonadetes bacterium]|nr:carboxypeptidase regulatory-like domain-containing protein [Armatimonadota bacterium]
MPRRLAVLLLPLTGALAAPTASLLEPISPVGWDLGGHSAVWADGQGHVAAVVSGKASAQDTTTVPLLLWRQGNGWREARLSPPKGAGSVTHLELVGRASDLTCLASFERLDTVLAWRSANGTSWTGPSTAATYPAGATPDYFRAAYAGDTPMVLAHVRTGGQAGLWLHVRRAKNWSAQRISDQTLGSSRTADLLTDTRGRVYATGIGRMETPLVLGRPGLPPLAPTTAWLAQPATPPLGGRLLASPASMAYDVARQQSVAVMGNEQVEELTTARLPLGALPGTPLNARPIPPPAGRAAGGAYVLAAGPEGTVVLVRRWTLEATRFALAVTPLGPDGPGAPQWLGRGATQTEAAEFIRSFTAIAAQVDPRGEVHVVAASLKLGAVPAGRERLFYGHVSGLGIGGSAPTSTPFDGEGPPPSAAGGGTITPPPDGPPPAAGPKPNLRGELRIASEQVLPRYDLPYAAHDGLELWLKLYNDGADYYGDLRCRIEVGGHTLNWVWRDDTHHREPLLRGGRHSESVPVTLRFVTSGASTPGTQEIPRGKRVLLKLPTVLGRLPLRLTVDPDQNVDETNEGDNEARCEAVVYDGLAPADQQRGADGKLAVRGFNDAAVFEGRVYVRPNAKFARFGLRQSPTWLAAVVENPRGARWMRGVKVVASLDGQALGERLADLVPNAPTLTAAELPWSMNAPGTAGAKLVRGTIVSWPLDLTNVPLGEHTLRVEVDPDDRLGDRQRDNNVATSRLRVRPPGGTLVVECLDSGSRAAVVGARVTLPGLWSMVTGAGGRATVDDFPPASYGAQALSAEKDVDDGKPYARKWAAPFAVATGQTTNVTLLLDGPVTIFGRLTGPDGKPPAYGASVGFSGTHNRVSYRRETGDYRIDLAEPGANRVTIWAYGYLPTELARTWLAGADGTARADIALAEAPKASIQGTVTSAAAVKLSGVTVMVAGTPSSAVTDAQGRFRIDGIMAGANYGIELLKKGYVQRVDHTTGSLRAGDLITCDMSMAQVTPATSKIGAHVLTWALCESYPGFEIGSASSKGYKVEAFYGEFKPSLALTSYSVQGDPHTYLGGLAIGVTPGVFWSENVSFQWNPTDLISSAWETVTDDLLGAVFGSKGGKIAGELAKLIDPLNSVVNLATGDVDPNQLHGDDELVGTWTSHTGDKAEETTLIDLPSTEVTVGLGFKGGRTTVRVDRVEISDGTMSHTYRSQWYSPRSAYYRLGDAVDWQNLEVTVYLQVMNENLSVGPLYANSRNRLVWKPAQGKWLRFEPFPYEP